MYCAPPNLETWLRACWGAEKFALKITVCPEITICPKNRQFALKLTF